MRTPGLRVAIIVAVAVLSVVLKGWLGRQHEQGKSERALAQLLTAARLDRAALDGLLNYMENTDISDLVHTPGLLTGWSEGEHNWLLQSALRERSLPGLQLAAGQGLVRAQTTAQDPTIRKAQRAAEQVRVLSPSLSLLSSRDLRRANRHTVSYLGSRTLMSLTHPHPPSPPCTTRARPSPPIYSCRPLRSKRRAT